MLITGGLHLDGLADTADAWVGGQGDRDRTLAIMKDPRSGPIAIAVIVLLLLKPIRLPVAGALSRCIAPHCCWSRRWVGQSSLRCC